MSELMRPIPFSKMIEWMVKEYKDDGSIFGIRKEKFYKNSSNTNIELFGDKLGTAIGPAAGPNSQLAQNIVASYLTGCRLMEVKTVQKMDGEDLRKCVPRPCINAEDECYNVEWSTELTVEQAFNEYVKAFVAIHVVMKELNISDVRDFAFNMSVGYDLEGIKSPKIDNYIENMKNAEKTDVWNECINYLKENIKMFNNFTEKDLNNISSCIASSITLSTLHGCPASDIENISKYLLDVKKVHTYIKSNPTILGYEFVRNILDKMGYEYISFDDHHFKADLQYNDAIALMKRLVEYSKERNLEFGVKLTNTFPVEITNKELPGTEMYMSGRSLYPLTINVAAKIAKEFNGTLPISFSGGADYFNIEEILKTGIQPITFATTILKPGGYERVTQIANKLEGSLKGKFTGIDVAALEKLANNVVNDKFSLKDIRTVGSRKTDSKLELFDCAKAPCKDGGCPIEQQIPEYLRLVAEGKYDEAFKIIAIDNTAPSITGTICDHQCQNKCTRLDYELPLKIRASKKVAADNAQVKYIESTKSVKTATDKKVAIIGAGPAGIAAAIYLKRNGVDVTVYEKKEKPYGIVSYVIPEFRIASSDIERDYKLAVSLGVDFVYGVKENYNVDELKKEFGFVIIATGAWLEGHSPVKEGKDKIWDALDFLEKSKANDCKLDLGKNVAVIGGGDVAMDCARAAKRSPGTENVFIVYRRDRANMPAEFEEIELAVNDNVQIQGLVAPISYDGVTLVCEKQKLGDRDASGRKTISGTGENVEFKFDTVIGAVGARVDTSLMASNGIKLNNYGYPEVNNNLMTNVENVYIAGDCKVGPKTIVKAMADSKTIAKDILAKLGLKNDFVKVEIKQDVEDLYAKKGILVDTNEVKTDGYRCLSCDKICEICVDVCPNRANMYIKVEDEMFGMSHQIVHLDGMCNECGNCGVFCPHAGKPYKDKVTLFWTLEDFEDSTNTGFLPMGNNIYKVRDENGKIFDHELGAKDLEPKLAKMLNTLVNKYENVLLSL